MAPVVAELNAELISDETHAIIFVMSGFLLPFVLNGEAVERGHDGGGRIHIEIGEGIDAIGGRHIDTLDPSSSSPLFHATSEGGSGQRHYYRFFMCLRACAPASTEGGGGARRGESGTKVIVSASSLTSLALKAVGEGRGLLNEPL